MAIRNKIKSAMIYPAVVMSIAVIVVILVAVAPSGGSVKRLPSGPSTSTTSPGLRRDSQSVPTPTTRWIRWSSTVPSGRSGPV